ncbi:MAG: threonine--tRNA ligase [Candidatus Cloacimonetes bacterium]|nr:threonine--tRNA ligase [Candidatus Cloacimonadota bacterium]
MINVTLPDGAVMEMDKGSSALDVAEKINHNLALRTIVAEVNGQLVDVTRPIEEDAALLLHTFDSEIGREVYWHSSAHLMAQAVKQLFPEVKVAIGPAIENGFYYDFDRDEAFSDEDLEKIEERMRELAQEKQRFERVDMARGDATKKFKRRHEPYKVELLEAMPRGTRVSVYQQGDFIDLCRGPHLVHTGKIKAVKLLKSAGAYWRGDERNKMLKRIYGITFPSKKELRKYLAVLEEAKLRDHRKLGRELDLFSISADVGPGLILWHPNGACMRNIIEDYWRKRHVENGYKLVSTPHLGKAQLWKTSGHLDFYSDSMFAAMDIEGQEYYVKPMNCPFHIAIYKTSKRSYRELPLRYAEMGSVYRYEKSGVLHGLMRVRGFTVDDAHIICTPGQLDEEVEKLLTFSLGMLRGFGFNDFAFYLATRPEKAVGEPEEWDLATESLRKALEKHEIDFKLDEGGGAFYGPKIDIKIKDSLGRYWQCTTIQFDFNLAERFEMEYIGSDNQPHRPYMIHRALLGSLERFFGVLIEHYAGNFPTWLCPTQVMVIPVSENFKHFAQRKLKALRKEGFRAEIDLRNEKIGYKIRDAEMMKIPYMFILGQREEDTNSVSIRRHGEGDLGQFTLEEAIKKIEADINNVKDEE